MIAVSTTALRSNLTELASAVRVPALVVTGSLDATCPVAAGAMMAETLGVEHEVVPDHGHVLSMEAPELVANLIGAAGANRVLTMDLHKAQIQGFFDIPVDHLFAAPVIIEYLARLDSPPLTLVAPDAGGAERARAYAKRLDAELAVIDKRRTEDGTAEVMNVIGDVQGRTCILQDDIIDTAGTIQKGAVALKDAGAARVLACAVHGVLSGPAIDRIENSPVDQLIVTNTIPLKGEAQQCRKIVVLSVARLLGQAIRSIHEETSVSSLFV